MKLLNLKLENFQGILYAEYDPAGRSVSFHGDNGKGKTTIANAICWLLFGKPYRDDEKNYSPQTRIGEDEYRHFLEHSAEARFQLDDGQIVTFKKSFHEKWKKKRGSSTEEFDGNTIDYYIDGVPVKEKEYLATMEGYCGNAEQVMLLTRPDYFANTLPWEQRRRLLMDICGDITDNEIIASNPELADLLQYLAVPGASGKLYTVDEYKKIAVAMRADINKNIQLIPARIDEATKAMPDVAGLEAEKIEVALANLQQQKDQLEQEKAMIAAGTTAHAEAKKRTAEMEAAIAQAKAKHAEVSVTANAGIREQIEAVANQTTAKKGERTEAEGKLTQARENLTRMQELRESIVDEFQQVRAKEWDASAETCPYCSQSLPMDRVEDMKSKFNLDKSTKLEGLNRVGQEKCSKDMIAATEREIATLEELVNIGLLKDIADLTEKKIALESKLIKPIPFEDTPEYKDLSEQLQQCKAAEWDQSAAIAAATVEKTNEIQAIQEQINTLNQDKAKLGQVQAQTERIEQLKAEEKTLAAEFEKTERGIYLCEQFVRAKVSGLTSRINSHFPTIRFRLFKEQVNGGLQECCEVLVPTDAGDYIGFSATNHGACMNGGLEIIDVLCRHFGRSMPVIMDNAESVTKLKTTESQTIRLVVSEPDQAIRMEYDDNFATARGVA